MSNVANNDTAATMARIAELEAMQAELKALKAKVKNTPRLKVSTKGAISVYGLQRMPVTLYAGQWERIMELVESGVFADFIAQNEATLTRKGEQPLAKPAVQPVAMGKAAKVARHRKKLENEAERKSTRKTKAVKYARIADHELNDGPTEAELAAIEADRHALGFDID